MILDKPTLEVIIALLERRIKTEITFREQLRSVYRTERKDIYTNRAKVLEEVATDLRLLVKRNEEADDDS
jgi:hypothetical protein